MVDSARRIKDLQRQVEHLRELRPRVGSGEGLRREMSLRNDVLFALMFIGQVVADLAGELCARRGVPFGDYSEALQNLARFDELPRKPIAELTLLIDLREAAFLQLDLDKAVEAMDRLDAVEELVRRVSGLLLEEES